MKTPKITKKFEEDVLERFSDPKVQKRMEKEFKLIEKRFKGYCHYCGGNHGEGLMCPKEFGWD